MLKKSLIETNPYLRNAKTLRKSLISSVSSSTAVETGVPVPTIARMLEESDTRESFTATQDSAQ